jgi:hypothetical protein
LSDPGTVLPKSFLEHYNLTVIPYSGKHQHQELEKLLSTLLKQVKKAPISINKNESSKLMQLIETEREFCHKLGTHIELERARFLKNHAFDLLGVKDKKLPVATARILLEGISNSNLNLIFLQKPYQPETLARFVRVFLDEGQITKSTR